MRELAHSRTGDNGDTSNLSVIAYRAADYEQLSRLLSAEVVQRNLQSLLPQQHALTVQRYELPQLWALNFVIPGILSGGVTRSLALDAHGKSLSGILLNMDISALEQTEQ